MHPITWYVAGSSTGVCGVMTPAFRPAMAVTSLNVEPGEYTCDTTRLRPGKCTAGSLIVFQSALLMAGTKSFGS